MTEIDAIRARNRQEHPRFLDSYPVGSPEWEWLRAAMDRRDLLAEVDRLTAERDEFLDELTCCREVDAKMIRDRDEAWRERDELAATVERVKSEVDALERDHAKDDASSGGWFFAMEAAIEGLRDALNGVGATPVTAATGRGSHE